MIEDCYIHQLKSIREKYFPQQLVKTSNQQLSIDAHSTSCNNTNRNTSDKHQYYQQLITPAIKAKLNREYSHSKLVYQENQYQPSKTSNIFIRQPLHNESDKLQRKGRLNYQQLLKDLDNRIIQKERTLSVRLNKNIYEQSNTEQKSGEQYKSFMRSNSYKDMSRSYNHAQGKSSKHEDFNRLGQTIRDKMQEKYNQADNHNINRMISKKLQHQIHHFPPQQPPNNFHPNYIHHSVRTNLPSKIIHKENPRSFLDKDVWSIGNLSNIQNRIKNVLKESNR